jgi:hypothetical protein
MAAAAVAGRCVLEGPWSETALCYHGACTADGACECLAGFRDDNLWFGGARCFIGSRWVDALVGLNVAASVFMLVLLIRLCKLRGPKGMPSMQGVIRLGIVCTTSSLTLVVASAASGRFRTAVIALLPVPVTTGIHAIVETLSVLLSSVEACVAQDPTAGGLRSERGRRRFVIGMYGVMALTQVSLLVVGLQFDDAEAARVASPAWWVLELYMLSTVGVLALVLARLGTAKASLVDMVSESIRIQSKGSRQSVKRMESLKLRLTAAFWALSAVFAMYASVILSFFVVPLLIGATPFGTVALLLGTICGPLMQIPVIIQTRKESAVRKPTRVSRCPCTIVPAIVSASRAPQDLVDKMTAEQASATTSSSAITEVATADPDVTLPGYTASSKISEGA